MNISIVIVSFKSFNLLDKLIENIPKENEIIVIENSLDSNLKIKLEKQYSNVQVIVPEKNLGYGKALNLGIKKSKYNYVMILTPDVSFEKECFLEISNILNVFNDFCILSPIYFDEKIYKNYFITKDNINKLKTKRVLNNFLREVDEIDGAMMVINKKNFAQEELYDENIFLYFENTDLCFRLRKNNEKIYIIENLKHHHLGTKSSDLNYQNEVLKSRSWHYCWSKFYFHKKHYNYLIAFSRTLPNFIKAIKLCIYYKIKKDNLKFQLHKHELLGLLNAYFLKASSYRPSIK